MLHVAALFVAGNAALGDDGAINATRIPVTSFDVEQIPLNAQIPVVLVVHAQAGENYDPQLYLVCKDPKGAQCGHVEVGWHWPDEENKASKYRCFVQGLPFTVDSEGEYTIGAYYDSHGMVEMATPVPVFIGLIGAAALVE
jgi:hypothetical protein